MKRRLQKAPKEWRCNSNGYRLLLGLLLFIFTGIFILFLASSTFRKLGGGATSPILLMMLGAPTLVFLWLYINQAKNLVQVHFHPQWIQVKNKKIPIQYLDSLHFIKRFKGKNGTNAFLFGMTFYPYPAIHEEIQFTMEF